MSAPAPVANPLPPAPVDDIATRATRPVGLWLLACTAMVLAMIVIGGLTRLTGSGLSMVEWRPVAGFLPPLDEAEWQRVFGLYQASPEYRHVNTGMTLAAFQRIFWWEYAHRLLGRLTGILFLLPLLWFTIRRRLPARLLRRLIAIFVLGALQGVLGWYMVRSGLVDEPRVSPVRLVAHLGLALLVLALLLWSALECLWPRPAAIPGKGLTMAAAGCVAITILSGGFMAGTHAGLTYNTFPLMDGSLVPDGYFAADPWYLSPFIQIETIQFHHRWLAALSLLLVLLVWWRHTASSRARRAAGTPAAWPLLAHIAASLVVIQFLLGIATLLLGTPLALAALHQLTATLLLLTILTLARARARCPG